MFMFMVHSVQYEQKRRLITIYHYFYIPPNIKEALKIYVHLLCRVKVLRKKIPRQNLKYLRTCPLGTRGIFANTLFIHGLSHCNIKGFTWHIDTYAFS